MQQTRTEHLWLLLKPVLARLTLAILFAIGAMFIFVLVAHEVAEGATRQFDAAAIHYFQAYHYSPMHAVMTDVSWMAGKYGMPLTVTLCLVGLSLTHRFWPDGVALLFASVAGLALIVLLKALFHRPRPLEVFANLGYSFPSGHSFFSLTIYGMMAYWLTRDAPRNRQLVIWSLAVFAILLVGFSRVFVTEHFPSDVIAGYAVGIPWLWGCLALPTIFHREEKRQALSREER
ncbi:MAG: phosphatase PAP2 family protein [Abitibacteriaceae bacterium]|nr:phosphatase PAP2 family protein [Abditibacteriaceae bacterium]